MTDTPAKTYDVGIIGAGAAGLTASIYASRYQLTNVVFGTLWGGEIANASVIENWPGDLSVTGSELTKRMLGHAKHFGAEVRGDKIIKIIRVDDHNIEIITDGGDKTSVREVIIATGTRRRHLNVPGEDKLSGRGVSYCATCDAAFFKDKTTAVVGGGDAAMTAALHVSAFSSKIYLLVRGSELGGEPIWRDKVKANPKIKILYGTEVSEVIGEHRVEAIQLSKPLEGQDKLEVEGVFVEIGADPETTLAGELGVKLDQDGYIDVSENMETSIPCVYAAGDVTNGNAHLDQIISGSAEGGLAARAVFYHLCQQKPGRSILRKLLSFGN